MAEIAGVPEWVRTPITATRRSLASRGVHVEPDRLLKLLLKRTLSVHGVQAAMAQVETDVLAEHQRKREEQARQLEERAAALRRGD